MSSKNRASKNLNAFKKNTIQNFTHTNGEEDGG
jgi:hypothetical protein